MAIQDEICRSIDRFKDQAIGLGRQIHARPELKFEERFAAGLLTGALTEIGVEVERGVAGVGAAFRAEARQSQRSGPPPPLLARYRPRAHRPPLRPNPLLTPAHPALARPVSI